MKKLFVLIIAMGMLLSSCGMDGNIADKMKSPSYPDQKPTSGEIKEPGGSANQDEGKDPAESQKVFENFIALIHSGKMPNELMPYLDREIGKATKEHAGEMVLAFEEVQLVYEGFYLEKFFMAEYATEMFDASLKGLGADILDRIKNESLKALVKEIFNGGYKLISREGSVYPILDYAFLKKYSTHVSPQVAEYVSIMSVESDKASKADGALVISWDELAERLLQIEAFTKTYVDFSRTTSLESRYYMNLNMYLVGLPNTPAYDASSKVYKEDVLKSFNNLIEKNGDSKSAEYVKIYLEILKKNNNTFSKEVKSYTTNLYEQNISIKGNDDSTFPYKYVHGILAALLPEKEGYQWLYNGFAEYGHRMTLQNVITDEKQHQYVVDGEIADMSDGESGRPKADFNINLTYTLKNAAIVQTKNEKMMMDSEMDSIQIIRLPLIEGNKWMQIAMDKSGNSRYLNSEITDIHEVGSSKVYTVEYRDMDSDYYEIRMIEEGIGVVSFTKLWQSENGDFEIGYSLYKEMSGY